jgi:hypothetical protein
MSNLEIDVEKLKEYMFRSSEQLKYLTEKTDAIDKKTDKLVSDVIKLKVDIENHPLQCPLNSDRIKGIVADEVSKIPEKNLNRNVKLATIFSTIISLATLLVVILSHFLNRVPK